MAGLTVYKWIVTQSMVIQPGKVYDRRPYGSKDGFIDFKGKSMIFQVSCPSVLVKGPHQWFRLLCDHPAYAIIQHGFRIRDMM
jgi:hypothetical protein